MKFFLFILLLDLDFVKNQPEYYGGSVFTFVNGTSDYRIPFKIFSSNKEYNQIGSSRDTYIADHIGRDSTLMIPNDFYYPSNEPPKNKNGSIHRVTLSKGLITYMEVLDMFNFDGNRTTPVYMATTWYNSDDKDHDNDMPGLLAKSVNDDGLLNVSFSAGFNSLSENETRELNERKVWEIAEFLCYYDGSSARLNLLGKCVIPYSEIIEHYKSLWDANAIPAAVNGERNNATNNFGAVYNYSCGIIRTGKFKKECMDVSLEKKIYVDSKEQFLPGEGWKEFDTRPTGLGYIVNTSYGFNRFKRSHDVNFTILFTNWTFDFPMGLLNNYRDSSFQYNHMSLEIFYWVEDEPVKPEREISMMFWVMCFMMIFPSVSLLFSLLIRVLTCSKYVFDLDVWRYKRLEVEIEEDLKLRKNYKLERSTFKNEERRRNELIAEGYDLKQV